MCSAPSAESNQIPNDANFPRALCIFRFHPGQFVDMETEFRQVVIVADLLCCLGGPCFQVKFLGRGTVDYNTESRFDQFRVVA
jgi:hypothetical protein